MSPSLRMAALVCGIALCTQWASAADEAEEAPPDEAFLEYLGLWEESDEEWLLYEEMLAAGKDDRADPETEVPAVKEDDDEG